MGTKVGLFLVRRAVLSVELSDVFVAKMLKRKCPNPSKNTRVLLLKETGRIRHVLRIGQIYRAPCVYNGEDGRVGVSEQTLVVPDRDPLRPGAPCDYICGGENDTVLTHSSGDVTSAEEEAVGDVGWAGAGGEVVEAVGSVGVGG
ncbi:hypothetical protein Vadar_025181 [Vaccinium darrowii]|uniref:Uncharacterized protein n=1 Tax=Vaccinium darrowii TaxID=229202 RepID=A0ACB7XCN3_9ERIC|nr:hypothetical protein Vadar_025181 [Vaccinium darrowii]